MPVPQSSAASPRLWCLTHVLLYAIAPFRMRRRPEGPPPAYYRDLREAADAAADETGRTGAHHGMIGRVGDVGVGEVLAAGAVIEVARGERRPIVGEAEGKARRALADMDI